MMSSSARRLLALAVAACWAVTGLAPASASSRPAGAAHYDHIFVIVEENHSFTDVIGNPAAPNLNALASAYGVATNYFGVTHPSEPNYVALLGGSPFAVNSDNAYYVQRVAAPSLISELDHAHVSWKAYLQGLPHPGYQGICYPANCNGEPDKDPLYVSKHDGIQNYTTSLNPADWSRQVPIGRLGGDLRSGHVPRSTGSSPTSATISTATRRTASTPAARAAVIRRTSAWSRSATPTSDSWSRRSRAPASGPRATTPSTSSTTRATTTSTAAAGSPTSWSPATARGT